MRIFFIISLLIYSNCLFSKEINLHFEIDWKSAHLADLFWDISIEDNHYDIKYLIKSYGITDQIFNYESLTFVKGYIDNSQLRPVSYKSKTKSTRQDVYTNILFNKDGTIKDFDISKEISKDQLDLQNKILEKFLYFTDPVSQLSQYFLYNTNSDRLIIDGLNIYQLKKNNISSATLRDDKSDIHDDQVKKIILSFPFFKGIHKIDKKNNLNEIHMIYKDLDKFLLPIQFNIFSKKFNAKLFLKNHKISK
ncbi:hypothetical protein OAO98_01830 [Alphaproteobacteria bacterium]|nr:hypothetical protein [Alphaproteobacteria bacterium]